MFYSKQAVTELEHRLSYFKMNAGAYIIKNVLNSFKNIITRKQKLQNVKMMITLTL
jgi:hypothetical protein